MVPQEGKKSIWFYATRFCLLPLLSSKFASAEAGIRSDTRRRAYDKCNPDQG
jgi:hypothetical protein